MDNPNRTQSPIMDAETQLENLDTMPFSTPGFTRLREKISTYIADLITEALKVSRRYQADTISAAHVERANENLIYNTSRKIYQHFGTIGGVFLGASLSHFISLASNVPVSTTATLRIGLCGNFLSSF